MADRQATNRRTRESLSEEACASGAHHGTWAHFENNPVVPSFLGGCLCVVSVRHLLTAGPLVQRFGQGTDQGSDSVGNHGGHALSDPSYRVRKAPEADLPLAQKSPWAGRCFVTFSCTASAPQGPPSPSHLFFPSSHAWCSLSWPGFGLHQASALESTFSFLFSRIEWIEDWVIGGWRDLSFAHTAVFCK